MYGADPVGFLAVDGDGRMMPIIPALERRADDAAEPFQGMMAYLGPTASKGRSLFCDRDAPDA